MKLDYGTQISPAPIELSCGTLRKPTLADIAEISFDKYDYYRFLLKMTPKIFYENNAKEELKEYWKSLSDKEKDDMTLMDLIESNEELRSIYLEMFEFFFKEFVVYSEGLFIFLRRKLENIEELTEEDFRGAISKETLPQILNIIQQICCISDPEEDEKPKFKNDLARKLYEKMRKSDKENKGKADINFTIPNIISALSSKHPSLNYTNIWRLTVFQLYDTFSRVQTNSMFDIDSTRVSVWGDEKKTFNFALWYKNEYDKK